ncbi:MAG: serine protein kinase RIO, partial [Rhodanobacter sp.]
MKTPKGLQDLIDEGVIDQVLRPLKSGKEASVYVVRS